MMVIRPTNWPSLPIGDWVDPVALPFFSIYIYSYMSRVFILHYSLLLHDAGYLYFLMYSFLHYYTAVLLILWFSGWFCDVRQNYIMLKLVYNSARLHTVIIIVCTHTTACGDFCFQLVPCRSATKQSFPELRKEHLDKFPNLIKL